MFAPGTSGINRLRRIALAIAFAVFAGPAQAENRYAIVELENATKNITITYQVRWGTGNWGDEVKLEPGASWNHWYPYEVVNQNSSPVPQVSFATGIGKRRSVQTYDLQANASPKNTEGGSKYRFEKKTDKDGDYIDLSEVRALTPYQEGLKKLDEKQYNEAVAAFTEAISKTPGAYGAYIGRAQAYRWLKQHAKSIDDCNAALKLNPNLATAYNQRGVAYQDRQEFDKAFEDYNAAISLQKSYAIAYLNRAGIHNLMGRYEEASTDLKQVLDLKPNSALLAQAHNLSGLVSFNKGEYEAAIAAYGDALAADKKLAIALSNRAAAYYRKGDYRASINDCNEAIQIQADLAAAYRWRSQARGRLGQIDAARFDYTKAVGLDPVQKNLFEYVGFLADRREALATLASFNLGSTVEPATLKMLNELKGVEPTEDTKPGMSANAKELIASETKKHDLLQFEMVAAANLLLKAATLSPQEREKLGWKLYWRYGPVTAPNNRAISKDGMAGLRILARLDLPDGKQIHAIFALKYFPPANPDSDDEGRVGLLSEADCLRLEVKLFDQGNTLTDYGHQSFTVSGKDDRLAMRPGINLDKRSGRLNREVSVQSLGTSCITCHLNGPRLTENLSQFVAQTENQKEIGDFIEQLKHWGAGKKLRQRIESVMKEKGPAGLLPLENMLRANQEQWVAIYPFYLERFKTSAKSQVPVELNKTREARPANPEP